MLQDVWNGPFRALRDPERKCTRQFFEKSFQKNLGDFFEKIHEIFRFFQKMILDSVRNLVSGFLVSGFYNQIRNLRDQGFSKH